jgi:hypothetical protein
LAKTKRPGKKRKRPTIADYALVIEDDTGRQLAVVVESGLSRAPLIGEEISLRQERVKDAPELAGSYVIHRVAHLPEPGGAVTIERYTIPWCYARRRAQLEPIAGELNRAAAAELAQRNRDLATELDDMADEVALAIHDGTAGDLDPKLVERLNDASRRAKQVSVSALLRSRISKDSE